MKIRWTNRRQSLIACGIMASIVGMSPACGKKEESKHKKKSTSTALASTPEEAVELLETATKSAGSKMTGMNATGLSLVGQRADGEAIEGCTAENEPTADGTTALSNSDPNYPLGRFYCMIAANSGDEGSVQGAFELPKAILCLAGDLTYDGKEHSSTVTLANSECFGGETPEGMPAEVTMKVTASDPAVGGGDGWDSSLVMGLYQSSTKLIGIKMLMKSSSTRVAVAFEGGGTATDAFSFDLDTAAGTLRYEGKFLRIPASDWSRHTRLLVTGDVSSDGVFSSVDVVQGAHAGISSSAKDINLIDGATLITVKGEDAKGYKTYAYSCGGEAGLNTCGGTDISAFSQVEGTGLCQAGPATPTCEGNDGLQLDAAADLAFFMRPASTGFQSSATWIAAISPLSFTSVTLTQTQD